MTPPDFLGAAREHCPSPPTASPTCVDLLSRHPTLSQHVADGGAEPWLAEVLGGIASYLPAPPTFRAFARGPFFRPEGHARCFYFSPRPPSPEHLPTGPRRERTGVIAFKGVEPLCPDHDDLLRSLQQGLVYENLITTQKRWAEHFALRENKVPGAFTVREGEEEARAAGELQARHLAAYGRLARVPLPLALFRFPERIEAELFARLRQRLSPQAFAHVEDAAARGFGAYVYYYPGPAARVSELDRALSGAPFAGRLRALRERVEPDAVLEEWIGLIARMMHLGYLPASLASFGTGNLCGAQNAIVDGGFVDLDSLTPISSLHDDTAFFDALHFSLYSSFFRTACTLLAGARAPMDDAPAHLLFEHLRMRLRRTLEREARPGLTLDPRIHQYLDVRPTLSDVLEALERYHPSAAELTLNAPYATRR